MRALTDLTALQAKRKARFPEILHQLWAFVRHKPLGAAGAMIIIGLVFTAIFAPVIAPFSPTQVFGSGENLLHSPDRRFLLGTDDIGRDVLSRVIFGSRISLQVGLIAVGVGTFFGSLFGIVSGYFGGKVDLVIQRVMDMLMAIPAFVLALAIMAMLGTDIKNVMLAIGIVSIPGISRVVRGATLSVKENQYIEAAKSIGSRDWRILFVHVFPNVTAPIIVLASIWLGQAIVIEAGLSYLGLGTPPPTPSWGNMMSGSARLYLKEAPWMSVSAGIAVSLAVLGFNLLGDALRDVWDPRLRIR